MKIAKIISLYTLLIACWIVEINETSFISANGWLAAILIYSAYVADNHGENK